MGLGGPLTGRSATPKHPLTVLVFRATREIMPMSGSRMLVCSLVLGALVAACSDDPGLPAAEYEVQVRTDSFFPSVLEIDAGERVRWVSTLRKSADSPRTVTSGSGAADPQAGARFDEELDGYGSGDKTGDAFAFRFDEPETVFYFSRLPAGREFAGRVIVR
jgi:plastocyanin